jgi:hypothetical protein
MTNTLMYLLVEINFVILYPDAKVKSPVPKGELFLLSKICPQYA